MSLLQHALLAVILYKLPLLLSFSLYFLLWHSLSAIKHILSYLLEDRSIVFKVVMREIIQNSVIAIIGLVILGLAGYAYFGGNNSLLYALFGLAILTTSHMHVMHHMFADMKRFRTKDRD